MTTRLSVECPLRIFIAEDQFLLRQGLENLVKRHGMEVVGSVDTGTSIVDGLSSTNADLALLDIRMPPTNTDEGIRAAIQIRKSRSGFPVVLLSQYVERLYLDELLTDGQGSIGYLLKDRVFDEDQFVESLRTVAAGGTAVDPDVITEMLGRRSVQTALSRLTAREHEVLSLMAKGESNSEISNDMFITEKAVAKHINSLFAKLELPETNSNSRRVLAVLRFLRS